MGLGRKAIDIRRAERNCEDYEEDEDKDALGKLGRSALLVFGVALSAVATALDSFIDSATCYRRRS